MILWLAVIFGVAFLAFNAYLYFVQGRILFYPSREIALTPADFGVLFEDVYIEVASGERVHGWFVPPAAPTDSNAAVVLFCHGNAGNISHRIETLRYLIGFGAGVLLFDYRGYGRSDGSPGELEVYEDAYACYDWLVGHKRFDPRQVVVFGRSLGGAVAVDLAARCPVRGLIVESSFTCIEDMGKKMFRYFPVRWFLRFAFCSIEKIDKVDGPVLVTHSPEDDLVPYEMGERLYAAARAPKRFVVLSGGHNSRGYFEDPAYRAAVQDVLSGSASSW